MKNYLERFDLFKVENSRAIIDELKFAIDNNKEFNKSVTFFGGADIKEDSIYYKKAFELSCELSKKDITILTGGGPGIMEAANRGSFETSNYGIGYNIKLPSEQHSNPYVTKNMNFKYFFSRKISLIFFVDAYIFFPGGFGTMDELFEVLTLIKTEKIKQTPIILFGEQFWKYLDNFMKNSLFKYAKTILEEDTKLYKITDDINEVLDAIK